MEALAGRDQSQTTRQMLTAPGAHRIIEDGKVEAHHPEQGVQKPFGLAQREMGEEPQGHGGFDGKIRVPPLPTPPAAPAGRPGSDRFRGHPQCHITTSNEGLVVGRPVRHAIFRLVRGMDLRLHPWSVAPAAGHEKGGPNRPTPAGSSCNNAIHDRDPLFRPAVREFVAHYHHERNHQGLDNRLIRPLSTAPPPRGRVQCRQQLGGMLHDYYRSAA